MSEYLGVASGAEGVVCFRALQLSAGRWGLARTQLSLVSDPYVVAIGMAAGREAVQRLDALGLRDDRAVSVSVTPRRVVRIAMEVAGIELVCDDDEALELFMHCAVNGLYVPMRQAGLAQRCHAIMAALMAGICFGGLGAEASAVRKALDAGGFQDGQARGQRLERCGVLGGIVDVVRRGLKIFLGVSDQGFEARGVQPFGEVGKQDERAGFGGGQLVAEKVVVHRFGSFCGFGDLRESRVGGGGQIAPAEGAKAVPR